jgi:AcrR family transcriptional regulator
MRRRGGYDWLVLKQPFHHGNLRAELLERAQAVLRERGVDRLSLRELARDAGVSHGAPRSHFSDRDALLEALAERGFDQLAKAIEDEARALPADMEAGPDLLRAAGGAFLAFATDNAALLGLMTAAKGAEASGPVHDAAARLFATMAAIVTRVVGDRVHDRADIERLTLLLSATVQGISAMVTSRRIPSALGDTLLDDTVRIFVAGVLGGAPLRVDNHATS